MLRRYQIPGDRVKLHSPLLHEGKTREKLLFDIAVGKARSRSPPWFPCEVDSVAVMEDPKNSLVFILQDHSSSFYTENVGDVGVFIGDLLRLLKRDAFSFANHIAPIRFFSYVRNSPPAVCNADSWDVIR